MSSLRLEEPKSFFAITVEPVYCDQFYGYRLAGRMNLVNTSWHILQQDSPIGLYR